MNANHSSEIVLQICAAAVHSFPNISILKKHLTKDGMDPSVKTKTCLTASASSSSFRQHATFDHRNVIHFRL